MADRYVVVEIDTNDWSESELEEYDNWGDAHEDAVAYNCHVQAMMQSSDPYQVQLVKNKVYEVREV